jgi:hypothetical protein
MVHSEIIIDSIIYIVFACILIALGRGLFSLLHGKSESTKTVKALTVRVGLSALLFVLLIVAFMMGWIKPHGLSQIGKQVEAPGEK